MDIPRHAVAPATGKAAMACITIKRAADDSYDHYYSLDWVSPLRRPRLWWNYRKNYRDHRAQLPPNSRVWVECPRHPRPWRRPRRQRA